MYISITNCKQEKLPTAIEGHLYKMRTCRDIYFCVLVHSKHLLYRLKDGCCWNSVDTFGSSYKDWEDVTDQYQLTNKES